MILKVHGFLNNDLSPFSSFTNFDSYGVSWTGVVFVAF